MKRKNILLAIAILTCSIMLLAGCNEKPANTTPTPEPVQTGHTPELTPTLEATIPGTNTGNEIGDDQPFQGEVTIPKTETATGLTMKLIRNHDFSNGRQDNTLCISSAEELRKYCEDYATIYDLDTRYGKESFKDAVSGYDEKFFEKNDLLLVRITASSGSISFNLLGVDFSIDESSKKRTLQVIINSVVPEIGTDDMAYYHMIVEISKEYKASDCAIKMAGFTSSNTVDKWYEGIGTEKH